MEPSHLLALVPERSAGWKYTRHVVELGTLRVPSGRLEASDPFVGLGQGLVFAVPPGDYPVAVTIADVSDAQNGSHLRETYLSVRLAEGAVARVEFLVPDGREAPESDDEYYGVPVDAGTVGFADAEAVARCMPEDASSWYGEVFDTGRDDSWFALMDSGEHHVDGAANVVMPLATGSSERPERIYQRRTPAGTVMPVRARCWQILSLGSIGGAGRCPRAPRPRG